MAGSNISSKDLNPLLRLAVIKGVEVAVKHHISRGDDLNAMDINGWTPLTLAIKHCKPKVISLLLEGGADINLKNSDGFTPLEIAMREKCEACKTTISDFTSRKHSTLTSKENDSSTFNHQERSYQQIRTFQSSIVETAIEDTSGVTYKADTMDFSKFSETLVDITDLSDGELWNDDWVSEDNYKYLQHGHDQSLIQDIVATQSLISNFSPSDKDTAWTDVVASLPKSLKKQNKPEQAPLINKKLKQLFIKGIETGRVSITELEDISNELRPTEVEAASIVLSFIGNIDPCDDILDATSFEGGLDLRLSKRNTYDLNEAIFLYNDLASGWYEPQRLYLLGFPKKILSKDEEFERSSRMNTSLSELIDSISRHDASKTWLEQVLRSTKTGDMDPADLFANISTESDTETEQDAVIESDDFDNSEGWSAKQIKSIELIQNLVSGTHIERSKGLKELGLKPLAIRLIRQNKAFAQLGNVQLFIKQYFDAREQLALYNLRLVFSLSRKYLYSDLSIDDIAQAGNIGLLSAVERFDPNLGYKFSTYGSFWITQQIRRTIANESRTIRYPVHLHDRINQVKSILRVLREPRTQKQAIEIISRELECSFERAEQLYRLTLNENTLSLTSDKFDDASLATDALIDDNTPELITERYQLELQVHRLLEALSEKESFIIRRRFGIGTNDTATLEELGQEVGVTRERIRQIESKALDKLSKWAKPETFGFSTNLRFSENRLIKDTNNPICEVTVESSDEYQGKQLSPAHPARPSNNNIKTVKLNTNTNAPRALGSALKTTLDKCEEVCGFNVIYDKNFIFVVPPRALEVSHKPLIRKLLEHGFVFDTEGRLIRR